MEKPDYEKAFSVACELLSGDVLYGIDDDKLFDIVMKENGVVSSASIKKWILNNLDRFSHDDGVRLEAIKRLGY